MYEASWHFQAHICKQNTLEFSHLCHTGWQSDTGYCSADRSRLASVDSGLHLGWSAHRKTEDNLQRMSPPRCVPARGSSPTPAAAPAWWEDFSEGLLLPWKANAEGHSAWTELGMAWGIFVQGNRAGRGRDYEIPGKENLLSCWIWKNMRVIRVKPKSGFRCPEEEAAVGEVSLGEEGAKATTSVITCHSKVVFLVRHSPGTRSPFPPPSCSEHLPTADTCSWARTLLSPLQC